MTRESLALRIIRAIYNEPRNLESFNAYQVVNGDFRVLKLLT